ncbi:DUF2510 domain-containing protein [Nocardioides sp. GXZ039]|uniref:DUF2510 domain-containing protein n=1 Tax=Nocardioides sp. GXZ039 TaxID=3136018 RepID=UPI0030F48697
MTHGSTPPGWYDDGQGAQRWWDGSQWTDQTRPGPGAPESGTGGAAGAGGTGRPEQGPDLHAEPTRVAPGGPSPAAPSSGSPSLDKGADSDRGSSADAPADVTRIAPQGAPFPGAGGAPGVPHSGAPHGAPPPTPPYGQQMPGGPGTPGAPGQPPYGQPGQPAWQQQPGGPGGGSSGVNGKLIGILGGAAVAVIIVIVLLFVFLSGGGGPKDTVEDVFSAVRDDGFCASFEHTSNRGLETDEDGREDAIKQAEKDCASAFEGEDAEVDRAEGCEFEVGKEEVDGDKATVEYKVTGCDNEDNNDEGEFHLVKEGGEWRIDG